jgi:predicted ABC-type ATPase
LDEKVSPNIYIIAGPNGAGKTTFAREFLPRYASRNFINADLIAQGMAPFSPEAAAFRAGRLMLEEIKLYAGKHADFAFETTLSGRSYLKLLRDLKQTGYQLHFFFLWLRNVELALSRIRDRVSHGGHDVPEANVRRRFDRSTKNFILHYRSLADSWLFYDASFNPPSLIAFKEAGSLRIIEQKIYRMISSTYGEAD